MSQGNAIRPIIEVGEITNAKEVRDGLEALGLLNLSGRPN
jgi:hypothetical protein